MEKKKLENILDNFSRLEKKLASMNNEDFEEIAKISKEYSDLKPLASMARDFLKLQFELDGVKELIGSDDLEMKKEAEVEEERLKKKF